MVPSMAALLCNDRAIVLSGLAAAILIAWAYLLIGPGLGGMMPAEGMAMPAGMAMTAPAWSFGYALIVFAMWAAMMVAMMLPSAAPTILLVAALARGRAGLGGLAAGSAGVFAAGYLLVWVGFGVVATALQWGLSQAGMLSPMMATADRAVASAVLIAAGIYQWTPFKNACLRQCRSPMATLLAHWRPGRLGALRSGAFNGFFCLGCCWVLMALLFVGGVMNFLWIAGIALLVLIEKTLPWGEWTARAAGALLVIWGAATLAAAIL